MLLIERNAARDTADDALAELWYSRRSLRKACSGLMRIGQDFTPRIHISDSRERERETRIGQDFGATSATRKRAARKRERGRERERERETRIGQDFTPRIHISGSDFASITEDGALCDERGQLGPQEFELVMRKQARPRGADAWHTHARGCASLQPPTRHRSSGPRAGAERRLRGAVCRLLTPCMHLWREFMRGGALQIAVRKIDGGAGADPAHGAVAAVPHYDGPVAGGARLHAVRHPQDDLHGAGPRAAALGADSECGLLLKACINAA